MSKKRTKQSFPILFIVLTFFFCVCYNSKQLNIYVHDNTTSLNTLLSTSSKLVSYSPTWTDDTATNGCHYNTQYNIYIYPVANVAEARLENEFDNIINPKTSQYTNTNDGNISSVKTKWSYPATNLTVDSGAAFAINVSLASIGSATIDKAEVR